MSGYFDRLLARAAARLPAGGASDLPDADAVAPVIREAERPHDSASPSAAAPDPVPLPPGQRPPASVPPHTPVFLRRQEHSVTKGTAPNPGFLPSQEHVPSRSHATPVPLKANQPSAVVKPDGVSRTSLASAPAISRGTTPLPAISHHRSASQKPRAFVGAGHAIPPVAFRSGATRPAAAAPAPTPTDTIVHIAIGRIDLVVTPLAPTASPEVQAPAAPAPQSLQAYLAQRATTR